MNGSGVLEASERETTAALRLQGISKTFPGTLALDHVSLEVDRGEIVALLGHNGSGKSTLIKILAGFHQPDSGAEAWVDDEPFGLGSSEEAMAKGLRFVHQDLGLIRELNAVDNVALTIGYSRTRVGQIHEGRQTARTEELLARFGVELDVTRPLGDASPVERTCVAIARALWDWHEGSRILVLDEPTASLPSREVSRLFDVVREVRAAGHAVLYVSHRMEEIFDIAEELVVLRAGRVVRAAKVVDQTPRELASLIAGKTVVEQESVARQQESGEVALSVRGLSGRYLDGIDLELRRGEVLGVAGLLGSGRDELPYVIAGARPSTSAQPWRLDDHEIEPPSSAEAPALGIAFVPAERAREGLVAEFTVGENLMLGALPSMRRRGVLSSRRVRLQARRWLEEIDVDVDTADRPVSTLSGGNQQRILLARCLYTHPSILVLSEPTAGVDVGARQALYRLLRERAKSTSLSILLASSDVEDLVSVCDRVLVLVGGRIADQMSGAEINAERIVSVMENVR
ncbi:MAG TPA: sugar ABC transporter ATP-binding protein [Solirubrobacteraceae bacterium]|jgi:ribose transport system ATP-binding protein